MGYKYKNSEGVLYYLNKTRGKNGQMLYFFSKKAKSPVNMPKGKTVVENPQTGLPLLKNMGF